VQLAGLLDLKVLSVAANPLVDPPLAVCDRGMAAIIDYMKDGLHTGLVINRKIKAMLVGDGEAGKTSFVQTLIARAPRLQRVGGWLAGGEVLIRRGEEKYIILEEWFCHFLIRTLPLFPPPHAHTLSSSTLPHAFLHQATARSGSS
jgi:hypothetical protein